VGVSMQLHLSPGSSLLGLSGRRVKFPYISFAAATARSILGCDTI
jgi:hypothetical protein